MVYGGSVVVLLGGFFFLYRSLGWGAFAVGFLEVFFGFIVVS